MRAVLSIGSNLGDRMARLQSAVDGIGEAVRAVSPVYETAPWGPVAQEPFLNAVLVAENSALDCHGWLRLGQDLERAAERVRGQRWGPRTLDVDVITCYDGATQLRSDDEVLTLPHPLAHERAFVLIPWLAVDAAATLTVGGVDQSVAQLLDGIDAAEKAGVRRTDLILVN